MAKPTAGSIEMFYPISALILSCIAWTAFTRGAAVALAQLDAGDSESLLDRGVCRIGGDRPAPRGDWCRIGVPGRCWRLGMAKTVLLE